MLPDRVREITDAMTPHLQQPHPPGPGVCSVCRNLIALNETLCRWCRRHPQHLDALAVISYSAGGHFLHRSLRGYKDGSPHVRERETARLAALLWRFLDLHERCLARAAGADAFDLVTTVPSRTPLTRMVRDFCWPTVPRYRPLLAGSGMPSTPRAFERSRFVTSERVRGASILLTDDTWTTGATLQSAAAVLRAAGASAVGAVVIGRYMNVEYLDTGARLASRKPLFDWSRCEVGRAAAVAWSGPRFADT